MPLIFEEEQILKLMNEKRFYAEFCVLIVYMEVHFQFINKNFTYIYKKLMYENSLVQLLVGAPPDYSKFDNDFKCKSDINFFFFFSFWP